MQKLKIHGKICDEANSLAYEELEIASCMTFVEQNLDTERICKSIYERNFALNELFIWYNSREKF